MNGIKNWDPTHGSPEDPEVSAEGSWPNRKSGANRMAVRQVILVHAMFPTLAVASTF